MHLIAVTFVILCGYFVDSSPTGSRGKVKSTSSIDLNCRAKMKQVYTKNINVYAASAMHTLEQYSDSVNDTVDEYPVDYDLPQDCPLERPTGDEINLSDRSLCPWYPIVNHDKFRYPQDLIEVNCRCDACIKVHEGVCERVYYNVPVLRYDTRKGHGKCESRLKWFLRPVSVGCTCSMKPSH